MCHQWPGPATENMIPIQPMRQLADAANTHDDWTGVTSATERRKRQNRLNSRAFRRRRAHEQTRSQARSLKARSPPGQPRTRTRTAHTKDKEPEALLLLLLPCWSEPAQSVIWVPTSKIPSRLRDVRNPLLTYTKTRPVSLDTVAVPLCPDYLIVLLEYNVLRACLVNRDYILRLLAHSHPHAESEEWSPTTVAHLPEIDVLDLYRLLPPSLHPTRLQTTVRHAG
ncbi:hypothetical protein G647_10051 [Cladophialophora carrionii CBS 160.54]|uniref:BZIP domain-containing protein n=1 Tax=Cladophialophora carrionii CBS 160.54 TaxID=1279043 RepID=V9DLX5_9EURO|nr:uncharacterized protein G647_10051 [Cladophialophora carrionii CBS 160.54]ETI26952.1 hypothetical protein G647_10051 [Cladophialophora carrionii CBS 160.54]